MARMDKKIARRQAKNEMIGLFKVFALSVVLAVAITTFVRPTIAKGQSMEPTIKNNDYLIVSCASFFKNPPQFGDLIVFNSPIVSKDGAKQWLKRVIGVEGDVIEIKDGKVYRNNETLNEPYITGDKTPGTVEAFTVEENSVFVLGDNRADSVDSRNEVLRNIKYEDIIGTAELRLFPLNRVGNL